MKFLDLSLSSAAANLACDEALLAFCMRHDPEEILRIWEPTEACVVLGQSNRVRTEVDQPACQARGIPILRRCTGGGTVVQLPGCLNYTLVLGMDRSPGLATVTRTNDWIMEIHRSLVSALLGEPVQVQGITDLTWRNRKFCGNAQRRGRRHVLFHGCFLLAADLEIMGKLLPLPSHRPTYRRERGHLDFLINLPVPGVELRAALRSAWHADLEFTSIPWEEVDRLERDRYGNDAWNFKL